MASSKSETTPIHLDVNHDEANRSTMIIERSRGWSSLGLKDVWEYRELLYFLMWREIRGAYRQTALGYSWIFLRPLVGMLVLSVVFGGIVQIPSDGLPYPLFSLSALLPWSFFSQAVQRSSRSLVDNMNIISKVYFPRMVIPISGTMSGLVDFAAAFLVFLIMLAIYQMPLRPQTLLVPVFLAVAFLFALAVGLWLATLSVKYRDVAFAVTFLLQLLMYLSPVIYPVSMVPEQILFLYNLNPMTGVIEGFRWALLDSGDPPGLYFLLSIVLVIFLLIVGAYIFRRTERTVVDVL